MMTDNPVTHGEDAGLQQQRPVSGSIYCTVCLEIITDAGERSVAKLKCGHDFHLDCIGSAFNAKGIMQCPNCRQVEHGQWLYANGCHLQEDFMEDITYESDYEVYGGMPNLVAHPDETFGQMPWHPFQGLYQHFTLSREENDVQANSSDGFSMREPLHYTNDRPSLHTGRISRGIGTNRTPGFSSRDGNLWMHQASASSSNPAAYAGGTHNFPSEERSNFSRPNNVPRGSGVYLQSLDSIHSGIHQGPNYGSISTIYPPENHGHALNQFQHLAAGGSSGSNSFTGGRLRHRADAHSSSQRVAPISSSNHMIWGSSGNLGQNSGDHLRGGWQADNRVESWIREQAYAPRGPLGTSHHWLSWAPPGGSSTQNTVVNAGSSGRRDGQLYGDIGSLQRAHSPSYWHQVATGLMWPPCGLH